MLDKGGYKKPPTNFGEKSRAPSSTGRHTPQFSYTLKLSLHIVSSWRLLSFVDSFVYSFVCSLFVEYPLCVCHCSFLLVFFIWLILGLNSSMWDLSRVMCKIFDWHMDSQASIALKLQQLRHVGLVAPWRVGS